MVNPNPTAISIVVTNVTTGQSGGPGQTINVVPGNDLITVSGQVNGVNSSLPCDCCPTQQCVNIQLPNGSIGHIGLNPDGSYLYGPALIPTGSTSFTVIAQYIPTGLSSGIVNVDVGGGDPTATITITGAAGQICLTDSSGGFIGQCVSSIGGVSFLVPHDSVIIFHGSDPSDTFDHLTINGTNYCPTGPLTDGQVQYQTGTANLNVVAHFGNAGSVRSCAPTGINPHINVVPTQVSYGGTVTITGSGFTALGVVVPTINDGSLLWFQPQTYHADINGNINGIPIVMGSSQGHIAAGADQVYVTDQATGTDSNPVIVQVGSTVVPMYRCSGGACIRDDAAGTFTDPSCGGTCTVTTPKYRCSGSTCVRDDVNGTTTDSNCNGACTQPTLYSCNAQGQCVTDPNGQYGSLSACQNVCQPPPPNQLYRCASGQCVQDANGTMSLTACQQSCSSACVCPDCCAGYTCQNGACVPSGVGPCGTGQTFVPVYNKCVNNTTLLIAGLLGVGGLYLLLGRRKKGNGQVVVV